MPWINKIMRKLPKKQITPEELGQQTRKNSSPAQHRAQTDDIYGYKAEKKLTMTWEENEENEGIGEDGEYEILEREILPEKIICPDCGGITLEGLDFCDKCGGELN